MSDKEKFKCKIGVKINHEKDKTLKIDNEYLIEVEVELIDKLERDFIKNSISLSIHTKKSKVKDSRFSQLEFDSNNKSISKHYFTPVEKGEEIIELDFLQNFEHLETMPCKLEIV